MSRCGASTGLEPWATTDPGRPSLRHCNVGLHITYIIAKLCVDVYNYWLSPLLYGYFWYASTALCSDEFPARISYKPIELKIAGGHLMHHQSVCIMDLPAPWASPSWHRNGLARTDSVLARLCMQQRGSPCGTGQTTGRTRWKHSALTANSQRGIILVACDSLFVCLLLWLLAGLRKTTVVMKLSLPFNIEIADLNIKRLDNSSCGCTEVGVSRCHIMLWTRRPHE